MQTAWRRRTTWAIAASVLAHVGVLGGVVLQRHTLLVPPDEAAGPPIPIIPLLLLPRTPPVAARGAQPPGAVRLHRRPQRDLASQAAVAPVMLPTPKPVEIPMQTPAATAPKPSSAPPALTEAVGSTLRTALGCTDARMASMSRDDRSACLERLGRGALNEPYLAPALSPEKRALLDQAGDAKMARKLAAERGPPGPLPATGKAEPQDYSGEPDVATNAVPAHSHPPSKRAAKVLGRLRP